MSASERTQFDDGIAHVVSDFKSPASPASRPSIVLNGSLETNDSMLRMERLFHHAFMKSRLESEDSVYVEKTEIFRQLDEYCDVDTMHQARAPVLLSGEIGSGKSAAVANWVERRKKMQQNWQPSTELIFYHVIGSVRQSCLVSNLLERMMREMKSYFELSTAMPKHEERLSWHLPNFLDAVTKKGRVIFVIDSLDRLCPNDGGNILRWLPVEFPSYVRVILTGACESKTSAHTVADLRSPCSQYVRRSSQLSTRHTPKNIKDSRSNSSYFSSSDTVSAIGPTRMERIEVEAKRRRWTILKTSPLNEDEKEIIIRKFLEKKNAKVASYPRHCGKQAEVIYENNKTNTSTEENTLNVKTINGDEFTLPCSQMNGFYLFRSQHQAIVSHSLSSNAAFLKILLTCLVWAGTEGFDIHSVLETWIKSGSVETLLGNVIDSIEHGQQLDSEKVSQALHFFGENKDEAMSFWSEEIVHSEIDIEHQNKCQDAIKADGTLVSSAEKEHDGWDVEAQRSSQHRAQLIRTGVLAPDGGRSNGVDDQQQTVLRTPTNTGETHTFKYHKVSSGTRLWAPHQLPPYLAGGCYVGPLSKLLGRALALLYVSRYGLFLTELRSILEEMHLDEEQATNFDDRRRSELDKAYHTAGMSNKKQEITLVISEDEWDALIRALNALDILTRRGILVLPMCNDTLRGIIWKRYLGSEEQECYYHNLLIRHFQHQPVTFRKIEELPWHLTQCRQWEELRATLVFLPNFQLLYTKEYKIELFSLWQMLIEGPSLICGANQIQNQDFCKNPPSGGAIYMDIVKEYARHIEEWRKSTKPSAQMISRIVSFLADFMFEFSAYHHGSSLPEFSSHPTLDLKRLYLDGMHFLNDLPHARNLPNENISSYSLTNGFSQLSEPDADTLLPNLIMERFLKPQCSGTLVPQTNPFYYYQRWVWIYFPWLALHSSPLTEKKTAVDENVQFSQTKNSFVDGVFDKEIRNRLMNALKPLSSSEYVLTEKFSSPTLSQSRSDIRLAKAGQKKSNTDEVTPRTLPSRDKNAVRKLNSIDTREIITPNPLYRQKITLQTIGGVLRSSVRLLPSSISISASPALQRSHSNKSAEKITFSKNEDSTVSAIRTSLKNSASSPLLGIRESHLSINRLTSNSIAGHDQVGEKSTFMTEFDFVGAHGFADGNKLLDDEMIDTSVSKSEHSSCGSVDLLDNKQSPKVLNSLIIPKRKELGSRLFDQDTVQSSWVHMQDHNRQVQTRLQQVYDDITVKIMKQQDKLHLLVSKYHAVEKEYEFMRQDSELAREALEEMHMRAFKLELLLQNIDKQDRNYRNVIAKCALYPAQHPLHLERSEKTLLLCQKTLENLREAKRIVLHKKSHLEHHKKPQFEKEMSKQKKLLNRIVNKLERAKEKLSQEGSATDRLLQDRLQLMQLVKEIKTSRYVDSAKDNSVLHQVDYEAADAENDANIEEKALCAAKMASQASIRSIEAKVAAQHSENLCAKVLDETGLSSLNSLLEKFLGYTDLQKSFDEQVLTYENHLGQMTASEEELKRELFSLEISEAATSRDELRDLQNRFQEAESVLSITASNEDDAIKGYNHAVAGITRIAKMLGTALIQASNQNLISENDAWLQEISFDESEVNSLLVSGESAKILDALRICCRKLCRMIDASERDPCTDAVLSVTNSSMTSKITDEEPNESITSNSSSTSRQNNRKTSKILGIRTDRRRSTTDELKVRTRSSIKASSEGIILEEKRHLEKKKRP